MLTILPSHAGATGPVFLAAESGPGGAPLLTYRSLLTLALVGLKLPANLFFAPRKLRVAVLASRYEGRDLHEAKRPLVDHLCTVSLLRAGELLREAISRLIAGYTARGSNKGVDDIRQTSE